MTGVSYSIQQYQNHSLLLEYKKLQQTHSNLKKSAQKMYDIAKGEMWKDLDSLNTIAISTDKDVIKIFLTYENKKKELIDYKLSQKNLKQDKVRKLFEIKNKRLNRHISNLNECSFGTSLNLLEEFYNNVYRDLERNSIKESEFVSYKNNVFEYELNLHELKQNKKLKSESREILYEF